MSAGCPWSLPQEKMVLIELNKDDSTWVEYTWDEDILNLDLQVFAQAAPDADVGRLLASVKWILC